MRRDLRAASLGALVLLGFVPGRARAQQAGVPSDSAAPGIQDNSFLVEEAYNQDPGVVQHISTMSLTSLGSWAYTFTQEWPVGGLSNQLSYTIPLVRPGYGDDAVRVGDVALNYRYQLVGGGETRLAISPRLTVMFPTGDANRGAGAGGTTVQWNLPVSYVLTPQLVMHSNIGQTVTPHARLAGTSQRVSAVTAAQSFIWLAAPRFNVMLESVLTRADAGGATATTFVLSPGVRWAYNFRSGLQIVPGVALPLTLHPGTQVGTILYLSFEHPFTKTD